MSAFQRLTEHFRAFPGIGPRQATRFVYHLLGRDQKTIDALTRDIAELRRSVGTCTTCYRRYVITNVSDTRTICGICSDPNRDTTQLMVVSRDADLSAVESHHVFNGLYFVLGGTLTFNDAAPQKRIKIDALKKIIQKKTQEKDLQEVIIATSANPEGEHTAQYVIAELSELAHTHNLTLSTLGRGLSTGLELEYSDEDTFKHALAHREKTPDS